MRQGDIRREGFENEGRLVLITIRARRICETISKGYENDEGNKGDEKGCRKNGGKSDGLTDDIPQRVSFQLR